MIDNKPGANSIIGVDELAKSPPDGYTFAVVIAAYAANISLYPKLPYDPQKDLAAVSLIGVSPLVAAVNNDAPFKNAADLIDYARKNPGKVSFGSSGNGSAAHLTHRVAEVDDADEHGPHPLQGRGAGIDGPDGRPDPAASSTPPRA